MSALGLWLPINPEHEEIIDRQLAQRDALERELKRLDPRLSVVLVKENAPAERGLVPGCWHVRQDLDPPLAPRYFPITTESGGYCEPHFGVLEELKRRDGWSSSWKLPEVKDHLLAEDKEKENRVEEIASDLRAAWRVPGEGGMTRRKWGRG